MLRTFLALIAVFALLAAPEAKADFRVEPKLVSNVSGITPGKPFRVGVHLKIASGWHTYWKNPGDAGLPISIQWQLPPGWKASPSSVPFSMKEAGLEQEARFRLIAPAGANTDRKSVV